MPTYTLSDNIEISFVDTGAPPSSTDYTTLIVLHGAAYNSNIFEKFIPLAHTHNLRIIILNRRDYKGSTKYTDSELDDLRNGQKVFLDRLGLQYADFMRQFIEKESIPAITPDRRAGGIAVLAWSLATTSVISLFSDAHLLSPELHTLLGSYLKDMIFLDPPFLNFGYAPPEYTNQFNRLKDPNQTAEGYFKDFSKTISAYYTHPNISESGTAEELSYQPATDKPSTVSGWTSEQLAKYCETEPYLRSEAPMLIQPMQNTISELATRAIFDETVAQTCLPNLRFSYLASTRGTWRQIFCTQETKRRYRKCLEDGKKIRKIVFYNLDGSNHFALYDDPELVLARVVEGIRRE